MPHDTSGLRDRLQQLLGGRYTLERELGGGGMSVVFFARDTQHGRGVVVKALSPEVSHSVGIERFTREIQTAAQLRHPHILPLLDSGGRDDLLYYIMPFAEGESLRARLAREGQLPLEDAVRIASQVASALDYAHRQGVIHRDIKPENILLEDGQAVVSDFGIARALGRSESAETLTETGVTIGTPAYMSPEQASAEPRLDGRSDIYSLGCVLYEMLAGEQPFTGPSVQAVIAKRLSGVRPLVRTVRPGVPPAVEEVVQTALAPAPADRFPTARVLADALTRAVTAPVTAASSPQHPRRRRLTMSVGAALGLVLLAVLATVWRARVREDASAFATASNSIAVLPFSYTSATKEREYLSDGLTEELIAALGRVPALRVAARTSSFHFKGRAANVRDIGEQLGVAHVLEGSMRTEGDRVHITVSLVNARDGFQIWSQMYDRTLSDVLAVQQEIARAIVNALRLPMGTAAGPRWSSAPVDPVAYDLYLRGRFEWHKRTSEGLERAADLFRQAIARDSGYASAYSGLADAYSSMFDYGMLTGPETAERVTPVAARALELDPASAEAHTSLAHVRLHEMEWEAALEAFTRAIELDPGYAPAYHWHALALTTVGRVDEAVAAMRQATLLDPLSVRMSADMGMALYAARRYDEAIAQERKTIRMDTTAATPWWIMGMALEQSGRLAEADSAFTRALAMRPGSPNFIAALARVHALAGRDGEARALLGGLEREAGKEPRLAFFVALVHTALGDRDAAIDWLGQSISARSGSVRYLKVEPRLDPLRGDPRYLELLRRARLPLS